MDDRSEDGDNEKGSGITLGISRVPIDVAVGWVLSPVYRSDTSETQAARHPELRSREDSWERIETPRREDEIHRPSEQAAHAECPGGPQEEVRATSRRTVECGQRVSAR